MATCIVCAICFSSFFILWNFIALIIYLVFNEMLCEYNNLCDKGDYYFEFNPQNIRTVCDKRYVKGGKIIRKSDAGSSECIILSAYIDAQDIHGEGIQVVKAHFSKVQRGKVIVELSR